MVQLARQNSPVYWISVSLEACYNSVDFSLLKVPSNPGASEALLSDFKAGRTVRQAWLM